MPLPIALQLYTVRDPMSKDLEGTLRAVKAIGFNHVELAGLAGKTAAEFKALLDKIGLKAIAAHDGWAAAPSIDAAVQAARTIGYKYVIQPWWPESDRTEAGYKKVVEAGKAAAAKAPDLAFGYHNHDFEFHKLPSGHLPFRVLFQGSNLTCELDTAWVWHSQHCPVDFMREMKGRVPLLHIKDLARKPDAGGRFFTEVGTGMVDVPNIVRNAADCDAKYFVVEQDGDWIDNDPLKSAKISYDNLRKVVG